MARILISGCAGEIGHSLIDQLVSEGSDEIVAIDLRKPEHASINAPQVKFRNIDITDRAAVEQLGSDAPFDCIFHLAAILSTGGERNPGRAHDVNVNGSVNLLELARNHSERRGDAVRFIFPSTIAAYGISTPEVKAAAGKIREDQHLQPITMYGINKLYVERLGEYYMKYFRFLESDGTGRIDFRSVRLPGVISAETVPTGGTSDYGPEMLHAAARGVAYNCFVTPDSRLPFMTMPDAVKAIRGIAGADRSKLTQSIYNVTAFSLTADDFRNRVISHFDNAEIGFEIHPKRNQIVASWPGDVDDSRARADWGWEPSYLIDRAFSEYLIPAIEARYAGEHEYRKCGNQ